MRDLVVTPFRNETSAHPRHHHDQTGEPMDDSPKDHCGVIAVYNLDKKSNRSVAPIVSSALLDLQHRGQLGAGMTSFDPGRTHLLKTHKDTGSVHEVFQLGHPLEAKRLLEDYRGCAAIGHVRYATSGRDQAEYAQPFERQHSRRWKWFSLAFNGNLANYSDLRDHLTKTRGYHMVYNIDTEVLVHHVAYALRGEKKPFLVTVFSELTCDLDGAYNIVFINADGDLVAARSPLGIRPLCYGIIDGMFVAASESVALTNMGIEDFVDVEPGEMVWVDGETRTVHVDRFTQPRAHAHCFFEWVYFAHVTSVLEKHAVYDVRWRLGASLASREKLSMDADCVVVAVPDTAKPIGDAFGFTLGIPSLEGIVRNRYVGRTFIEGEDRAGKVRRKYTLVTSVLRGRRVFLTEDSLVRATTLRGLVDRARTQGGAKEVHLRIGSPPVIAPCFYGIDMSTLGELYAPKFLKPGYSDEELDRVCDEMARQLGADSLRYLPIGDLAACVGLPHDHLCTGCVTGRYPTKAGERIFAKEQARQSSMPAGRSYEVTAVDHVAADEAR